MRVPAALVLLLPVLVAADDWPTLRRTNYVALLGTSGKKMAVSLKSEQRASRYGEELCYMLVGPDSNELACGDIALGKSVDISAAAKADGLCVLELEAGWNVCHVDSAETPLAYIASGSVPLHTIRVIERLHFYVPTGCKRFTIYVQADVTGEAARVQVFCPDGTMVKEEEDDFDRAGRIKLDVPAGADGKAWSLAVVRPKTKGLGLDDVTLWLDEKLPPYLSKRAEWASAFGKRKHD